MSRPFSRRSLSFLFVLAAFQNLALADTAPRPLRASQVMALEAGKALQSNLAQDIRERGLSFSPDEEFLQLVVRAGADPNVVAALKAAKVDTAGEVKPDKQLLQQLSDAAVLFNEKKYGEAGAKLSDALDTSFARVETGYVMAALLQEQKKPDVAVSVYEEILEKEPDFPEVHGKLSVALYQVGDGENALHEAKLAIQQNPNDAEAHKAEGLALSFAGRFDAAVVEYKEALRIKPDYAVVRYDLGLLYYNRHSYDDAIAEYKKAIALDPKVGFYHYNLALAYKKNGDIRSSIAENREAKRVDPNDPYARQNLASALMEESPGEAIKELQELERLFPNFGVCHICLGRALVWQGDLKAAEAEFRKANEVDPTDPNGHRGLASIQEKQKNFDAALEEYRIAERIAPEDSGTRQDIANLLIAKKDYTGAMDELKQAEAENESSWKIHELYAQALLGAGQTDLAIGEFKEAIALDPTQAKVKMELGTALEKKGDWAAALTQYRDAALADRSARTKAQPGQPIYICGQECSDAYTAVQGRFADYLVKLKAEGKAAEAADLQKSVAQLEGSAGTEQKVQLALKAGDDAFQMKKIEEAEKSYKRAVELAGSLPPGDESLIAALGRLGNAYAMRQDYTDAEATLHRQLEIVEKTFGPESEKVFNPLRFLGQIEMMQKHYKEAESYLQRALDINTRSVGDNNPMAVESLRGLAHLYEVQGDWPKAEVYLLRAVKGAEGAGNGMVTIPLWGLCDLYDRWDKPDKGQPCWHRATDLMATQFGENSPNLTESLASEAKALRKLGRADEAEKVEERIAKIHRTSE
jgi:tetratricopeptide (TPR) repeat protein